MESDRQVEGLKARVKDIQGLMWDEISERKELCIADNFIIAEGESDFTIAKAAMTRFIYEMENMTLDEFSGFSFRVKNLLGMVFVGNKLKCVTEEIDRIITESSNKIRRYIAKRLKVNLERKVEEDK